MMLLPDGQVQLCQRIFIVLAADGIERANRGQQHQLITTQLKDAIGEIGDRLKRPLVAFAQNGPRRFLTQTLGITKAHTQRRLRL